jgi:hypothetical protein
VWH